MKQEAGAAYVQILFVSSWSNLLAASRAFLVKNLFELVAERALNIIKDKHFKPQQRKIHFPDPSGNAGTRYESRRA